MYYVAGTCRYYVHADARNMPCVHWLLLAKFSTCGYPSIYALLLQTSLSVYNIYEASACRTQHTQKSFGLPNDLHGTSPSASASKDLDCCPFMGGRWCGNATKRSMIRVASTSGQLRKRVYKDQRCCEG